MRRKNGEKGAPEQSGRHRCQSAVAAVSFAVASISVTATKSVNRQMRVHLEDAGGRERDGEHRRGKRDDLVSPRPSFLPFSLLLPHSVYPPFHSSFLSFGWLTTIRLMATLSATLSWRRWRQPWKRRFRLARKLDTEGSFLRLAAKWIQATTIDHGRPGATISILLLFLLLLLLSAILTWTFYAINISLISTRKIDTSEIWFNSRIIDISLILRKKRTARVYVSLVAYRKGN